MNTDDLAYDIACGTCGWWGTGWGTVRIGVGEELETALIKERKWDLLNFSILYPSICPIA